MFEIVDSKNLVDRQTGDRAPFNNLLNFGVGNRNAPYMSLFPDRINEISLRVEDVVFSCHSVHVRPPTPL